MDFRFTEEQELLRASIGDFLRDQYDHTRRLKALESGACGLPGLWTEWAELGWLSLGFAEEDGGLGLGPVETMLLCEAFGRHNVLEPYAETVLLAGGLLTRTGGAARHGETLAAIMAGTLQAAFAYLEPHHKGSIDDIRTTLRRDGGRWRLDGHKAMVGNGQQADLLLVSARGPADDGLSLLRVAPDAPGVSRRDYRTIDGRGAADFTFDGVLLDDGALLGEAGKAAPIVEAVLDEARFAAAAEIFGAMQALLDMTVDYAKQRKQFGVAIGQFQALQHKMADMFIDIELTRSLLYATAIKRAEGSADAALFTTALKAKADQAGRLVAHHAIQIHGAIATTNELAAGHYLKRLLVLSHLFGGTRYHLARYHTMKHAGAVAG